MDGEKTNVVGRTSEIKGAGICSWCGGQKFNIGILWQGGIRAICVGCGEAWEAPIGGTGQDPKGHAAVGEIGDVGADVVSAPEGNGERFNRRDYMRNYMRAKRAAKDKNAPSS
jgi:hypothetical protein